MFFHKSVSKGQKKTHICKYKASHPYSVEIIVLLGGGYVGIFFNNNCDNSLSQVFQE